MSGYILTHKGEGFVEVSSQKKSCESPLRELKEKTYVKMKTESHTDNVRSKRFRGIVLSVDLERTMIVRMCPINPQAAVRVATEPKIILKVL